MRYVRLIVLLAMSTLLLAADKSRSAKTPKDSLAALDNLLKAGRNAEAETAAREQLIPLGGADKADTDQAALLINRLVEAMVRGGKAKDPEARALASVTDRRRSEADPSRGALRLRGLPLPAVPAPACLAHRGSGNRGSLDAPIEWRHAGS